MIANQNNPRIWPVLGQGDATQVCPLAESPSRPLSLIRALANSGNVQEVADEDRRESSTAYPSIIRLELRFPLDIMIIALLRSSWERPVLVPFWGDASTVGVFAANCCPFGQLPNRGHGRNTGG